MSPGAIFGAVVLALLSAILWRVWRLVRSPLPPEMQQKLEEKEQQRMAALEQRIAGRLTDTVRLALDQFRGQVRSTEQSVSEKLQEANTTIASVSHQLGMLQAATKNVEEVGRNVASLQDLLRAPKMRGGIGEFFLADLLTQILPGDFFSLQHEFSDGERVDAVIRLRDRMVPVDSKFPLDNFRRMGQAATDPERAACRRDFVRDVKQHIDAISEKYIRPGEGTFDFALMYIPAENVYYETIIKDDGVGDDKGIFQHALRRQVIPVSPNSFYAYLQVILQGLRGMAVEQRAREIVAALMKLEKELAGVREDFDRASKQMGFARENFEKADKHLARFEDRLGAIESPPAGQLPALPPAEQNTMQEVPDV
ncbi:MAG: DNA recombination protein RmuC [Candidatus Omnitrophica bacterium]|nr:DNA recombination protein RmuC [Candidatus Omnitrophota bacterium]